MFSLIVAMDRNGAIGKDNQIPWKLRGDMVHFKTYTAGKTVLMGYNTAVSVGKALPGRINLVLSRTRNAPFPGQIIMRSRTEVLMYAHEHPDENIVVCGGPAVYSVMWPYVTEVEITEVDAQVEGADAHFSFLDQVNLNDHWNLTTSLSYYANEQNEFDYCIRTYRPKRPVLQPVEALSVGI